MGNTTNNNTAYDPNVDYKKLMDDAAKAGNYAEAARYEVLRNQKIADLNAAGGGTNQYGATQTNQYSKYLNNSANNTSSLLNSLYPNGQYSTEAYKQQEEAEKNLIAQDPSRGQYLTQEQMNALANQYGVDPNLFYQQSQIGGFTQDQNAAISAGGTGEKIDPDNWYADGDWYYYPGQERDKNSSTSGADEDLLNDGAYALVKSLQNKWWELESLKQQAQQSGRTDLVSQYAAQQQQVNTTANQVRLTAGGYSGGADGSLYLTAGALGVAKEKEPDRVGVKYAPGAGNPSAHYSGHYYSDQGLVYHNGQYVPADSVVGEIYGGPPTDSIVGAGNTGGNIGGNIGNIGGSTGGNIGGNIGGNTGGNIGNTAPLPGTGTTPSVPNTGTTPSVPDTGTTPTVPDTKPSTGTADDLKALLDAWQETALSQKNAQVDYAVAKAVADLERALADAQPMFKEQAESVDINAQQAMDNAALYAEMRGDRGGIGQEQYNSIQNTRAQNHLTVQQAQTKLATDTQRQIADLRAQGEFAKADAALEISQNYLAKLASLEQWAAEYDLTVDQFNAQMQQLEREYAFQMLQFDTSKNQWQQEFDTSKNQWQQQFDTSKNQWQQQFDSAQSQWEKEYAFQQLQYQNQLEQWEKDYALQQLQLQMAQNQWQSEFDASQNQWQSEFNASQNQWQTEFNYGKQSDMANIGWALLESGVSLSKEQLAAMGIDEAQASQILMQQQLKAALNGGNNGGNNTKSAFFNAALDWSQKMLKNGSRPAEIRAYLEGLVDRGQITADESVHIYMDYLGLLINDFSDSDSFPTTNTPTLKETLKMA